MSVFLGSFSWDQLTGKARCGLIKRKLKVSCRSSKTPICTTIRMCLVCVHIVLYDERKFNFSVLWDKRKITSVLRLTRCAYTMLNCIEKRTRKSFPYCGMSSKLSYKMKAKYKTVLLDEGETSYCLLGWLWNLSTVLWDEGEISNCFIKKRAKFYTVLWNEGEI